MFQHQAIAYRAAVRKFRGEYLRSFTNRHPGPSFILHWRCDFSSYKRNAVLMTMRKAKVSLACQRHRHNSRQLIWQISRKPTDPALLEIERRGDFSNSLASCRDDRVRESQLASRASKCLESSALSAAFRERRTASNTASGEISLMHLRPVRHTPL